MYSLPPSPSIDPVPNRRPRTSSSGPSSIPPPPPDPESPFSPSRIPTINSSSESLDLRLTTSLGFQRTARSSKKSKPADGQKAARLADHWMVVVKNSVRDPMMSSPSPATSPGQGKYPAKEVSPLVEIPQSLAVDQRWSEEKENLTPHCLSGRFPFVSAFKQYQNAAMEDLLGLEEYRPGVKL